MFTCRCIVPLVSEVADCKEIHTMIAQMFCVMDNGYGLPENRWNKNLVKIFTTKHVLIQSYKSISHWNDKSKLLHERNTSIHNGSANLYKLTLSFLSFWSGPFRLWIRTCPFLQKKRTSVKNLKLNGKQCRSWWDGCLIWICTVCKSVCFCLQGWKG